MSDEPKPPVPPTPSLASPRLDADKKTAPKLSPEAVSRDESKARQWGRSFLRWAGLALVVFGLGALAAIFLFYIPKTNELNLATQDLATADAQMTELQTEITSLENQIAQLSTLEETNQTLQTELDQAQSHIYLLDALADIRNAQFALAQDDAPAAQTALTATAATLTELQERLDEEQADMDALLDRLKLAQGELETNPFAAQSDLEVLANGLLKLEQTLFDTP
jgi:cytoskeletal protein RodZ